MWKWLEKIVGTYDPTGTYDKPLRLTKEYKRPKRARTKLGRYKADDKSTSDYNEAWVGGRKPKKKRKIYIIRGKKYVLKKGKKKGRRKTKKDPYAGKWNGRI